MDTKAELEKIIAQGESDCVEFTTSVKDLDKIRQAICAFANDLPNHNEPGFIFVGLDDRGCCADLTVDDSLLQKLGGLRNDGKIHPFPSMAVEKETLLGGDVAVIKVSPTDNPPVKSGGVCWVRTGPRKTQATAEDERRLMEKRRWGNLPYDMHGVPGASVKEDLNMARFENEYRPNSVSPEVLLQNNRALEDQLQVLRLSTPQDVPTVTAILMLNDDPGYWFPGAYIQFMRVAGAELGEPVKNQRKIIGTLPEQLRELDEILKVHIAVALDTSGQTHIKIPDYPYAALRELTRNAVIHRNYERSNAPVRVYWFDDRIEISNPGSVYGAVNRDNFGDGKVTDCRNPTIAEAMKNMGFMERFGMGIKTARQALIQNGNPPPKFEVESTMVLVTVKSAE